jgi:hypothetical protein
MPLYTFLMDFKGGTYIRQIKASSPKFACVEWAKSLDTSKIVGLGKKGRNYLVEEMKNETPTPINQTVNAWCTTALIRGNIAIITLIRTEQEN